MPPKSANKATNCPTRWRKQSRRPSATGAPSEKSAACGSTTPRLWTNTDEAQWLGWLDITEKQLAHKDQFKQLADEIKKENFTDILLLGMGGSSLCPEVLTKTYGQILGFPRLHVLDSTDPAQVKATEAKIDLAKTLFIVSSKSGTTLEPNIFKQYFFERVKQTIGAEKAGSRFIAVTDPGSKLQSEAEADKFRHIFAGVPSIGGRYSALSDFGMVPAAAMGLDVAKFLDRTEEMVDACVASFRSNRTPASCSASFSALAAKSGRDKVTIIASPAISDLGAWLEQLLAESTGKQGKGIIPVDREHLAAPATYGNDRIFAYVRYTAAARLRSGRQSRRPRSRWASGDPHFHDRHYDLGQEFFRWEIATAVAGSIIGINAFNQPDVEASKIETRKLTTEYEKVGSLPAEKPIFEGNGIQLFTDPKNAAALKGSSLTDYLRAHLARIGAGDYFAVARLRRDEHCPRSQAAGNPPRGSRREDRSPLASASARASCTPPDKPTKAAPTAAYSCRSHATTPTTCKSPAQNIPSASSKPRRPAEISRSSPTAAAAPCESISGKDVDAGLSQLFKAVTEA